MIYEAICVPSEWDADTHEPMEYNMGVMYEASYDKEYIQSTMEDAGFVKCDITLFGLPAGMNVLGTWKGVDDMVVVVLED